MSISKEAKEYCMNNLVVLVTDTLCLIYPNISRNSLLLEFSQSNIYAKLYDPKTRLWAEGPDYILGLYGEEKGIKFAYLED